MIREFIENFIRICIITLKGKEYQFQYDIDIDKLKRDFINRRYSELDKYVEPISYEDLSMKEYIDYSVKTMLEHLRNECKINHYIKICLKYGQKIEKNLWNPPEDSDSIDFLKNNTEARRLVDTTVSHSYHPYFDFFQDILYYFQSHVQPDFVPTVELIHNLNEKWNIEDDFTAMILNFYIKYHTSMRLAFVLRNEKRLSRDVVGYLIHEFV